MKESNFLEVTTPQGQERERAASPKRVPAVKRAAEILWELSDRSTPMNLSQISRAVDVIPRTCLHILRELVAARLISYDVSSKTYQLGSGLTELARSASRLNDFAGLAQPRLQTIANRFNMTATATSKVDDQHLALVAFANPPNAISLRVTLGGRVPLLSGASGRCFAAFGGMSEKQIKQGFNKVKWARPIDFKRWMKQVESAAHRGYAEDVEAFVEGVTTFAVPIVMPDGTMTHTIGVFAITAQLEVSNREEIILEIQQAAAEISARLSR